MKLIINRDITKINEVFAQLLHYQKAKIINNVSVVNGERKANLKGMIMRRRDGEHERKTTCLSALWKFNLCACFAHEPIEVSPAVHILPHSPFYSSHTCTPSFEAVCPQ